MNLSIEVSADVSGFSAQISGERILATAGLVSQKTPLRSDNLMTLLRESCVPEATPFDVYETQFIDDKFVVCRRSNYRLRHVGRVGTGRGMTSVFIEVERADAAFALSSRLICDLLFDVNKFDQLAAGFISSGSQVKLDALIAKLTGIEKTTSVEKIELYRSKNHEFLFGDLKVVKPLIELIATGQFAVKNGTRIVAAQFSEVSWAKERTLKEAEPIRIALDAPRAQSNKRTKNSENEALIERASKVAPLVGALATAYLAVQQGRKKKYWNFWRRRLNDPILKALEEALDELLESQNDDDRATHEKKRWDKK
ncbi:MAG: hypothetical protein ACRBCL_00010 [Maritimibacter sp.]